MNVLVIGGVAAGTKTAAKLKRLRRDAKVTLITKDTAISYAGCGLPYYVGGMIPNESGLIVNTPQSYSALTGVEVFTGREATKLDSRSKIVTASNLQNGKTETYSYDKVVIATGASPIMPPIPGIDLPGVFKMRTPADAITTRSYIKQQNVRHAVVVGAGFIGLEVAENLKSQGIAVTVIDFAFQILPNVFDLEMAAYLERHLKKQGIHVLTQTQAQEILGSEHVTGLKTQSDTLPCEMVVMSVGIRPNTAFLSDSGLAMEKGAILVDSQLRTNLPDVYAAGDCALVSNRITHQHQWSPMGSSANLEGRTLAQVLTGANKSYPGVLGTGIVKLPSMNCGRTGLTEAQAKQAGYDVVTALAVTDDKAHYYPDSAFFITKLIADRSSHRLLGAQILGPGAVDKMVDIAVMGIQLGAKLEDFENTDFAYAPPFSTAIHPFVQAVYVLLNKLSGDLVSMTPLQYLNGEAAGYRMIDVAPSPTIPGATFVDLTKVNGPLPGIEKEEKLLLVCVRGKRAYFLQNRLRYYGYTNTMVLEGATSFNDVKPESATNVPSSQNVSE